MRGSNGHLQVGGNTKLATIGILSLILLAMVVAVIAGGDGNIKTTSKVLTGLCNQGGCNGVYPFSADTSDPKTYLHTSLQQLMKKIRHAAKESISLKELETDPMTTQALDICQQVMDYAADDLQRMYERMGVFDITKVDDRLGDLQIWLSAVVAYQETCLDAFKNVTSNAGLMMREGLSSSAWLTSNALKVLTHINAKLNHFIGGPLLGGHPLGEIKDATPKWFTGGRRGLLANTPTPNVVVAQDGTGKYKTIREALKEVPQENNATFVIYIKAGVYKEYVQIERTMNHVMFIGDGPLKTKIIGSRSLAGGYDTFRSATVTVLGDFFVAKDIGFENSAGPLGYQAVALLASSDESIYYNCQIDGYQDTLYTHAKRQFYRDCTISGTIDFVFGDSVVVFQKCRFIVRKPADGQQCIVTAQGRKDPNEVTGIVIQDSIITADPLLEPLKTDVSSYLARPWKDYSRTIFINTEISDVIHPDGYMPWAGTQGQDTCFYGEINNKGPGADTSKRLQWKGVKKLSAANSQAYSAKAFLKGDAWITASGVPYNA